MKKSVSLQPKFIDNNERENEVKKQKREVE